MVFQRWALALVTAILLPAFAREPNAEEPAKGWKDLFDGNSLDGWRGCLQKEVPSSWEVRDGGIFCNGKDDARLVTRKKYGDFELTGEWKISKAGNSGILLRVVEVTPWPASSGLEVQVIDHSDGWKAVRASTRSSLLGRTGSGGSGGSPDGVVPAIDETETWEIHHCQKRPILGKLHCTEARSGMKKRLIE